MKVVVGQGSCGIATGAKKTAAELEKQIAAKGLDVKVDITGCVGTCYLEPIVDVYDDNGEMTRYVKVQPDKVAEIVESHLVNHKVCQEYAITPEDEQFLDKQQRVVLRNCGKINPENIDEYLAVDGYKAIEKVLKTMKPEEVIEEIKISGLRGRGGARYDHRRIRYGSDSGRDLLPCGISARDQETGNCDGTGKRKRLSGQKYLWQRL